MIDIKETREKLRQFGVLVKRMQGNDTDKRRILVAKCNAAGIAPVLVGELD